MQNFKLGDAVIYAGAIAGPGTKAIVASDDLAFGLLRMYEVFGEDNMAELMVFRTEAKARTWLGEI